MKFFNNFDSNSLKNQYAITFIDSFNQHTSTVASIPTALFRMTKSIRELKWVLHLQFIFESCGYSVSLRLISVKQNLVSYEIILTSLLHPVFNFMKSLRDFIDPQKSFLVILFYLLI